MEVIFWLSVALVAYVYVGYPAIAWLLARMAGRPVRAADVEPSVTVLIAAYNEADHIEETVRNKLEQNYPPEKLDVLVVSDASDDGTDDIVQRLGPRVKLIRQEPRAGKTAGLNLAARQARGEILVFADANSLYASDAVRTLVRNFADPGVGYVTGKMVYTNADGSLVGDGCSAYMRYENFLRGQESHLASVIGVDGGVDAMRRNLFRPMAADQQSDFILPLTVSSLGYRVVFEPAALLREAALADHASEYRMRVRVALRAMWSIKDMRELLNPFSRPVLAWQIWSHKVLRYGAFVPLLTGFASCASLAWLSPYYRGLLALGLAAIGIGALAWARGGRGGRWTMLPYYLLVLHVSAAHAFIKMLRGVRQATWAPRTG